ncbi:MAG: hypothetical protein E5X35_34540 [Mesorhizobium sp.]|nr:MAG: hypothetical protein E5X35_34540 [Mesorhizobium sp.]
MRCDQPFGREHHAFLARLRRGCMLERLRNWANDGGLLIGTSAGSILMTPSIAEDALFGNERPENLKDGAALDLVPFEFFPSYLPDLLAYSTWNSRPIIFGGSSALIVSHGKGQLATLLRPLRTAKIAQP